jgi:F0F1-type ATP synthase membrane subunit b/b'
LKDEDKIFSLIAQAEDMQAHAVKLQQDAQDALKKIQDASKGAVKEAAREFIIQGAETASKGLVDASRGAEAAAADIRGAFSRACFVHVLWLILVALVVMAGLYFGTGYLISSRIAEAERLKREIAALEARAADFAVRAGKAVLTECGGRLCVRVDERAGRYGEPQKGELYMVLFNY